MLFSGYHEPLLADKLIACVQPFGVPEVHGRFWLAGAVTVIAPVSVTGVLKPMEPIPTLVILQTIGCVPADTVDAAVTVKLVEVVLVSVTVEGVNVIPAVDESAMVSVP